MKGRQEKAYVDHGSISDGAAWCFMKALKPNQLAFQPQACHLIEKDGWVKQKRY